MIRSQVAAVPPFHDFMDGAFLHFNHFLSSLPTTVEITPLQSNQSILPLFCLFFWAVFAPKSTTSMPFNISELSVHNIHGYREFVREYLMQNYSFLPFMIFIRHFHPLLLSNCRKPFLILELMILKCGLLKMVITYTWPGCHIQPPWITHLQPWQFLRVEELKSCWRMKHSQTWDNSEKL